MSYTSVVTNEMQWTAKQLLKSNAIVEQDTHQASKGYDNGYGDRSNQNSRLRNIRCEAVSRGLIFYCSDEPHRGRETAYFK